MPADQPWHKAPLLKVPFLSDAWWNAIAGLGPSVATLIGTIVVARILGREGFGRFSLVQASVVAFGLYAPVALGATGAKAISEFRFSDPGRALAVRRQITRLSILISSACALCVASFADVISRSAFGDTRLGRPLQIAAIGVIVLGALATVTGSLSGHGRFRQVAVVGCVRGIATVPCLAVGAWAGGVGGAVAGLVLAGGFGLGTAGTLLRRYEPAPVAAAKIKTLGGIGQLLVGFSLPVFIGPGVFLLVNGMVSYLIAKGPGGAGELALWNAAMQVRLLLLFVPTTLATPILVGVSAAWGAKDGQRVTQTVRLGAVVVAVTAIVPAILMWLGSGSILGVFGESFSGTSSLVEKVIIATIVSTVPFVIESALRGVGYAWSALAITITWAVIMVVAVLLTPSRDASSTASLFLFSYLAVLPLAIWLWSRARHAMWSDPIRYPGMEPT